MKTAMLWVCLGLSLQLFAQTSASPASGPASKEDVTRLFETMQLRQQMPKMLDAMTAEMRISVEQTVKSRYPRISSAEMQRLDDLYTSTMKDYPVNGLLDDMIPVYQKYLTRADVEAMIAFYSSPTGKKLMDTMPQMTQEAMRASYARMQSQMESMLDRMDKQMQQEQQEKPQKKDPPKSKL